MKGSIIMDIPVDLKNALESGVCVLFVGAGMGIASYKGLYSSSNIFAL